MRDVIYFLNGIDILTVEWDGIEYKVYTLLWSNSFAFANSLPNMDVNELTSFLIYLIAIVLRGLNKERKAGRKEGGG